MIDDKKIEEACDRALKNSVYNDNFHAYPYVSGFYDCAKWMQKKLLKDLWHPIEEKPDKEKTFLYQISYGGFGLNQISDKRDWDFIIKYHKATQWMYMEDLFSKKGDE